MARIENIKENIESLSKEDFTHLREWIADLDWDRWDRQLEEDAVSGKLDFLREEAINAKEKGKLRDL